MLLLGMYSGITDEELDSIVRIIQSLPSCSKTENVNVSSAE